MNADWTTSLTEEKRRLIFGNEDADTFSKAYDKKRTVHAGSKGEAVPPEETHKAWMYASSQPSEGNKLVYVNVPFCQTRCLYCGFFKNLAKADMMEAFTGALVQEIQTSASLPVVSSGRINAVYIGGGTPGALSAEQIAAMLNAIKDNLPLANDCEFTFETRTYQLTDEKIEACLNAGVNRFSLGVQSFDTKTRRSIGRVDEGETVMRMLEKLKALNEATVSIDLMFGLPYQTESGFLEDILTADRIGVDGMALYQLNVFDDGRLMEKIKEEKLPPPPTTAEQSVYFIKAQKLMQQLGYMQPSMAHWVRDTRDRSLYNRMTKQGHTMHAFGAGAGGRTPQYGYFTHMSLEPYLKMVQAGRKPIMGLSRSHERQRLHNLISSQIDCGYLRGDMVDREAGFRLTEVFEPLISSWEERRLAERVGSSIKLTPQGQFWYVNMAQSLIDVTELFFNSEYTPTAAKVAAQN
ncbi:heme anaerobic degradation radical SAM methyltransferase ChuW/HutW [Seleniivibrio woodruffii]|uniref:Oxygen-independent coproporphyrinogen-3 oxidase n=1 Tax=Seleniivibrio woodruffii TaxID=1078050 RepID=A0A4R1K337_9BACT|nr:heme anaerobic degradation radical SAM methyltransferase ChuW/HutW [Seleniivibrio woodruffii]TCK58478.1 oxygen-independent coproporphyrinogen-3 oxidase [Seleniivibrio woodruffii]TVZ36851.1 oxygen-independent coproporphyrinogen-3 oxidase [Seleniivibrio woodruffii]